MSFTLLDLKSYLQHYSPESILSDLSSFESREGSEDLCRFLQESYDENGMKNDNFIEFEKNHLCRVYFILSERVENANDKCVLNLKNGMYPIYGYFSISAKILYSNNISDRENFPKENRITYLIGHLCKNTSYNWNKEGEYMLQQCFEIIESVHQKIGIGYILIECNEGLIDYYSNQNFKEIGYNKKNKLHQMIRKAEEAEDLTKLGTETFQKT